MAVRPEEFELLLVYSVKLPLPFGYSLLFKRESCFLFVIQYVAITPPLLKRRWIQKLVFEDGGVLSHRVVLLPFGKF